VPGDQETGATALFLQSFAEQAEEVLAAQYTAMADALNSPLMIMTNSGVINIGSSISVTSTGSSVNVNTDTYRSSNGPAVQRRLYRTGLWQLGFYINASCVGTVNSDTYRRGYLRVTVNDVLINTQTNEQTFSYTTTEKNNTAQGLSAEALFFIPPETPPGSDGFYAAVSLGLSHGNSGSQMTIAAGNAKMWAFWLSDDDLIREV
jgi:hypothetical protein